MTGAVLAEALAYEVAGVEHEPVALGDSCAEGLKVVCGYLGDAATSAAHEVFVFFARDMPDGGAVVDVEVVDDAEFFKSGEGPVEGGLVDFGGDGPDALL